MSRIHAPRHFPERHQRNVASATGQTQTTHPSRHDEQDKKVARKLMPGFELHPRKLITHLRGGVQQGLRNLRSKPGSAARALRHQRVELSTTVLPGYNQHCDNCANLVKHYIREVDSWKRSSAGSGERSPGSTPRHNDSKIVVFDHHINLGALRTSAISSCHLCNLLDSADPGYPFTYHQHSATQYVIQINIIQGWRPSHGRSQDKGRRLYIRCFEHRRRQSSQPSSGHTTLFSYQRIEYFQLSQPMVKNMYRKHMKTARIVCSLCSSVHLCQPDC